MQPTLDFNKAIESDSICEQVLIRLILSGMYPIRRKSGGWMYFISEKGHYIGTPKDNDFNAYWEDVMYFKGEGQMSNEEREKVKSVDYLLTEEYIEHFEKWKNSVLAKNQSEI